VLQAATPLAFWWLSSATVYALGIAAIAAIYVGFAVADGRPKVIGGADARVSRATAGGYMSLALPESVLASGAWIGAHGERRTGAASGSGAVRTARRCPRRRVDAGGEDGFQPGAKRGVGERGFGVEDDEVGEAVVLDVELLDRVRAAQV
jgi:hypothetical protein